MTKNEMMLMEQLKAAQLENAKLKAKATAKEGTAKEKPIFFKVSEKGWVSIYGLMRFPVTVHAPGLLRVLAMADELKAFIETNKASLKWERGTPGQGPVEAQTVTSPVENKPTVATPPVVRRQVQPNGMVTVTMTPEEAEALLNDNGI